MFRASELKFIDNDHLKKSYSHKDFLFSAQYKSRLIAHGVSYSEEYFRVAKAIMFNALPKILLYA